MKYAVVTGSTKGIGKAIAEKLLMEGWFVFINYFHDDEAAFKFVKQQTSLGINKDRFEIIKADLSDHGQVQMFIDKVLKRTQMINCLVINAGATDRTPFESIDYKIWENVINTNINGSFHLVHGFRNNMVEDYGRIIFIGSICGIHPHSVSLSYGITKAALHEMAKNLVKFFAPKRITVNAIAPGFIDTQWQKEKHPEHRKRIEEKIALRRFGLPEEVASLCWEIINNQYINGSNLIIDGGYSYR